MANVSICQTNVSDTWHYMYHQGAKLHIYFWYKTPCHQLKHVRNRVIRTEVNVQGVVSPCFSMFFPCFTIMKKHGHGLEHRFQNYFFVMNVIHLLRHIFFLSLLFFRYKFPCISRWRYIFTVNEIRFALLIIEE